MDFSAHYDAMWQQARPRLLANQLDLDPLLDAPYDPRRGLTLIARPRPAVRQAVDELLQELRALEPEQYYYPPAEQHLTVLTLVSAVPDFTLAQVEPAAYVATVAEALRGVPPLPLELRGLTASAAAVLVQGFPLTDGLEQLRARLRAAFRPGGPAVSIDRRYVLRTAHSTVVRFRAPLRQPAAFVRRLEQYRAQVFGPTVVDEIELVYNDWYHRAAAQRRLALFALGSAQRP